MARDDEIPNARMEQAAAELGEPPQLRLGDPFAISFEADLVDAKGGGGCTAILECDCGQKFRVDLLAGGVKFCPKCDTGFTHALLVSGVDNTELVAAAMEQVLVANGLKPPSDEGEGDDEGEGEGDDDDDDEYDDEGDAGDGDDAGDGGDHG